MMGELVAGLDVGRHRRRRTVDRVAGREEGRLDVIARQQRHEAGDDHDVILATRDGGGRSQTPCNEARQMIMVESKANDMARHGDSSGGGGELYLPIAESAMGRWPGGPEGSSAPVVMLMTPPSATRPPPQLRWGGRQCVAFAHGSLHDDANK